MCKLTTLLIPLVFTKQEISYEQLRLARVHIVLILRHPVTMVTMTQLKQAAIIDSKVVTVLFIEENEDKPAGLARRWLKRQEVRVI